MIFLQIQKPKTKNQKPKTKNQKPKQCAKSFEVKASGMKEE
jgi:murein endopeptidase